MTTRQQIAAAILAVAVHLIIFAAVGATDRPPYYHWTQENTK